MRIVSCTKLFGRKASTSICFSPTLVVKVKTVSLSPIFNLERSINIFTVVADWTIPSLGTIEPNVNWLKAVPSEGIVQSATTVKILIDRSRLKIGDNETVLTLTTNVGEKQIDVEAFRPKSFVQDTIRTDFSPWQWMYRYDVY